mgnify:CR=1 FL=1
MLEEYKGTIAEIIFHNNENGYTVAVFETELEAFTVVGTLPAVSVGRHYRLRGEFTMHPTYGEQFAIREFEEELPSTEDGIRDFLASGAMKGVGRKTAAAIVERFGENTLQVIEEDPGQLCGISGIGPKTAAKISEAFKQHREFANITLYLQNYGINSHYAMKLYEVYGADTIQAIEENPYQLVDDIFGIGFKKADKIAEKMGIAHDDRFRIQSGIKFTLTYFAGEGNTFLPQEELCEKTGQMLDLPMQQIEDNIAEMAFTGEVHVENLDNRTVVFLMSYYLAEQNVCKCLSMINDAGLKPVAGKIDSLIQRTERSTGIFLSENQKHAVTSSLKMGVSVITGGPGTGKTTIINTIINILEDSGLKTAIAAPTGRAAKRMSETSNKEAKTIHRLLEIGFGMDSDDLTFMKNEEDPIDADVVILDEVSMVDVVLMYSLLRAIKSGTRLLIVGDSDQLPSVGAGNVLKDLIDSEVINTVRLNEIFRQAQESMIVVNAHKINKGEPLKLNVKGKDFFFIKKEGDDILQEIVGIVSERLPKFYGVDKLKDIQVLSPMRKGTLGVNNLNIELQKSLNPPNKYKTEEVFSKRTFRVGDKVMQIKNNYTRKWKSEDGSNSGHGIYNGDIGYIYYIDKEKKEIFVIFDSLKIVTYKYDELDELDHSFCTTIHKSQGSEFPIVVIPMAWAPPMLLSRNLLYTAVTRAKKQVVLVGEVKYLEFMIKNNRSNDRYSNLAVKLNKFKKEGLLIEDNE